MDTKFGFSNTSFPITFQKQCVSSTNNKTLDQKPKAEQPSYLDRLKTSFRTNQEVRSKFASKIFETNKTNPRLILQNYMLGNLTVSKKKENDAAAKKDLQPYEINTPGILPRKGRLANPSKNYGTEVSPLNFYIPVKNYNISSKIEIPRDYTVQNGMHSWDSKEKTVMKWGDYSNSERFKEKEITDMKVFADFGKLDKIAKKE